MSSIFNVSFYVFAILLLILSFKKDREKTKKGIRKGLSMMLGVLPQFLSIMLITGAAYVILTPDTIQRLLGTESGIQGMVLAAIVGTAALVPVLAVFPVVSQLLENGVGTAQMAVFISTLTTVGLVTLPLEFKYLGVKTAVWRNLLFFLFAFATSYLLGVII